MMLAARGIFLAARKPVWTNPYVTDGLVAMWDGEWNVEGGVHDPNAKTWVDLVGGLTIPVPVNSVSPLSVGFSQSVSSSSITHSQDTYSLFYTCRFRNVAHKSGCIVMLPTTSAASSAGFYSWNVNIPLRGFRTINFRTVIATADWPSDDTFFGQLGVCYRVPTGGDSQSPNLILYLNGTEIYRATEASSYAVYTSGKININTTIGSPLDQDVFGIKWYSRALTAAEIAANYAEDKARFNLP